jgi:general secretion pathway protein D
MQALFKITSWGGLAHAMSAALLALLVAACEGGAIEKAKQHDPLAPIREADFSAPPPETLDRPAGATVDEQDVKTPAKTIVPGNGSFAQPPKGTARFAEGEGGIQLSFDNADLREVVRIVLGDILGIDYILDPRVQGSVTFSSTGPLPRDLMLSTLETVLRMNNASIAVSDSIYRVIPTAEVIGQPSVVQLGDQNEPLPAAHGLTIVPLNHVSAGSMVQLLENVVARPGAVRPDPVRNLLLVTGTSRERSSILATVSSFDVDWLRGQSAGIFPLKHGTPETLIVELESIFQSQPEGLGSNLVRFQPIERLNAVLVIARRLELLQEAELWIERLDQANTIGLNL